jgi:cbb3-type cytochrome oxidase subunit 1
MNRKLGVYFLKTSLVCLVLSIIMGTIMTLVPVYDFVMSSGLFARAHAHLSLIGWVSFAIIGFIYLGLDHLNKHIYSERLGCCGFCLFSIGMFIEFVTLVIGGCVQGYSVVNGDLNAYAQTIPYTIFTIISAFVMSTGAFMTIYNICKTMKSK